jgi:hypothetical protein
MTRILPLFLTLHTLFPLPATLAQGTLAPPSHVEKGACPFECCRYGKWTSLKPLTVFAAADPKSSRIGEIPPGTPFQAVTGQTQTAAGVFVFTRSNGPFHAGDRISVYNYLGEGNYRVWWKGKMTEAELLVGPQGSQEGPAGKMETRPAQTWWVQLKMKNGRSGWAVIGSAKELRGADACGQ